jgi:hypothetical protein
MRGNKEKFLRQKGVERIKGQRLGDMKERGENEY